MTTEQRDVFPRPRKSLLSIRRSQLTRMSGVLDPDSNVHSDEEENPLWWKEVGNNSMHSVRYDQTNYESPALDSNSDADGTPLQKSWYRHVDNTAYPDRRSSVVSTRQSNAKRNSAMEKDSAADPSKSDTGIQHTMTDSSSEVTEAPPPKRRKAFTKTRKRVSVNFDELWDSRSEDKEATNESRPEPTRLKEYDETSAQKASKTDASSLEESIPTPTAMVPENRKLFARKRQRISANFTDLLDSDSDEIRPTGKVGTSRQPTEQEVDDRRTSHGARKQKPMKRSSKSVKFTKSSEVDKANEEPPTAFDEQVDDAIVVQSSRTEKNLEIPNISVNVGASKRKESVENTRNQKSNVLDESNAERYNENVDNQAPIRSLRKKSIRNTDEAGTANLKTVGQKSPVMVTPGTKSMNIKGSTDAKTTEQDIPNRSLPAINELLEPDKDTNDQASHTASSRSPRRKDIPSTSKNSDISGRSRELQSDEESESNTVMRIVKDTSSRTPSTNLYQTPFERNSAQYSDISKSKDRFSLANATNEPSTFKSLHGPLRRSTLSKIEPSVSNVGRSTIELELPNASKVTKSAKTMKRAEIERPETDNIPKTGEPIPVNIATEAVETATATKNIPQKRQNSPKKQVSKATPLLVHGFKTTSVENSNLRTPTDDKWVKAQRALEEFKQKQMAEMKMRPIDSYFKATGSKTVVNDSAPKLLMKAKARPKLKNAVPPNVNKAYLVNGVVYKRPKLPRPKKWATDRLYKFLMKRLEPKYEINTRARAEKFVIRLSETATVITRRTKYDKYKHELNDLIREMARLKIIKTRHEFHLFCQDYMPYSFRIKTIPMILPGNTRNIPFHPQTLHTPIIDED